MKSFSLSFQNGMRSPVLPGPIAMVKTVCWMTLAGLLLQTGASARRTYTCRSVRTMFKRLKHFGGKARAVPTSPQTAQHPICHQRPGGSCCTSAMEGVLLQAAETSLQKAVKERIFSKPTTLLEKGRLFLDNNILKQNIEASKWKTPQDIAFALHIDPTKFKKGTDSFWDELVQGILGHRMDAARVTRTMFRHLEHVLKDQVVEDLTRGQTNSTTRCIKDISIKYRTPRGYVRHYEDTVSADVLKVLTYTSLLNRTLTLGTSFLNNLERFIGRKLPEACRESLLRLQFCGQCWTSSPVAICNGLCANTLNGCWWPLHEIFNGLWIRFSSLAEDVLSIGLHSTFDLPHLITDIPRVVLEAAIDIHANILTDLRHATSACGMKREVRETEYNGNADVFYIGDFDDDNKQKSQYFFKNMARYIKETRHMFYTAPSVVCASFAGFSSQQDDNCWTGTHVGKYEKNIPDLTRASQTTNPEVSSADSATMTQDVEPLRQYIEEQLEHMYRTVSRLEDVGTEKESMQGVYDVLTVQPDTGKETGKKRLRSSLVRSTSYDATRLDDEDEEDRFGSGNDVHDDQGLRNIEDPLSDPRLERKFPETPMYVPSTSASEASINIIYHSSGVLLYAAMLWICCLLR